MNWTNQVSDPTTGLYDTMAQSRHSGHIILIFALCLAA